MSLAGTVGLPPTTVRYYHALSGNTTFAMNSTVTVKGQITIPKAMRQYLGLAPGDQVAFAYLDDGGIRITAVAPRKAAKAPRSRFAAVRGRLKLGARTDELMRLLRGYDEDAKDPGFK